MNHPQKAKPDTSDEVNTAMMEMIAGVKTAVVGVIFAEVAEDAEDAGNSLIVVVSASKCNSGYGDDGGRGRRGDRE